MESKHEHGHAVEAIVGLGEEMTVAVVRNLVGHGGVADLCSSELILVARGRIGNAVCIRCLCWNIESNPLTGDFRCVLLRPGALEAWRLPITMLLTGGFR